MQLLPCPCGQLNVETKRAGDNGVYMFHECPGCGMRGYHAFYNDPEKAAKEWNRRVGFDLTKRLEFDPYPAEGYRHCSLKRYFMAVERAARLIQKGAQYAHVHYTDDDFMAITVVHNGRALRIQTYKVITVEYHGNPGDEKRYPDGDFGLDQYLHKQGVLSEGY